MGALKSIADKHQIAMLLVHHDRKMKDDADPFNKISGTNGIMGAADTIMLITKKERSDGRAVLKITGRDVEPADLVMELDLQKTYRWHVVNTLEQEEADRERHEYENDPVIRTIKGLLAVAPMGIELTAREFSEHMPQYADTVISEREIGHAFRRLEPWLYKYDRITHRSGNSKTRKHSFIRRGVNLNLRDINATNATEEEYIDPLEEDLF
jgi:hypothetical protein